MKHKSFFIIISLLFLLSCKSQNSYSQETLKNQSQKILDLKKSKEYSKKNNLKTVNNILRNLEVQPKRFIAAPNYSGEKVIKEVFFITLYFEDNKEFRYKMDNKIKLYNIVIYFVKPIPENSAYLLARSTKGIWNKEAKDFFGNMEVKDVKIYDLEK